MITVFKTVCYVALVGTYVCLSRQHFRNIGKHCNRFSLKKCLGITSYVYRPVKYHWFYVKIFKGRTIWEPFSKIDSLALEKAFVSSNQTVVITDGGRYDSNILLREKYSVYWNSERTKIRRCSWFYKRTSNDCYIPYEEDTAVKLESEFQTSVTTNRWCRKINLKNGDTVMFYQPNVYGHFSPGQSSTDTWGETVLTHLKPGAVKRGAGDFDIDEGESATVDHLLFIVHGIGSACDLKFRTIEEVVDELRENSRQLIESHYALSLLQKTVNRIEVLPINWHVKLHSEDTGIDKKLKNITLSSVPRLRYFINDTLSDIFLYKSSKYCQTILTVVGSELNRMYALFKQRNPNFSGDVSLGGHSLGSVILFDLLCHQKPESGEKSESAPEDHNVQTYTEDSNLENKCLIRRISSLMLEAGINQIQLEYPHLHFHPHALFAFGSPIALFVTTGGLDKLGCDFTLPTCKSFFNIFHPYDPVASRIETLINPKTLNLKPVLIPHHKGGKRMHLQIREVTTRITSDFKRKLSRTMKHTKNKLSQIKMRLLAREIGNNSKIALSPEVSVGNIQIQAQIENKEPAVSLGMLNKGRRIDYVLQEASIESFNEYIFALTLSSHLCYWESKDTMLLILKEIYDSMAISTDEQISSTNEQTPQSNLHQVNN